MPEFICLCSCCHDALEQGQDLLEHKVLDFDGSLDYIELAHRKCGETYNLTRPGY